MSGLSKIITELSQYRKLASHLHVRLPTGFPGLKGKREPVLVEIGQFGTNPGNLRMLAHVPERLAPRPALVVVLHGCTQTAEAYDLGAGWSALADEHGFALLYPQQKAENNPNTCFSWFDPARAARDRGEALSIRQMIERMASDIDADRDRIFITGLSAGGAMTSVMLAAYPEVFAAGAIIAGLPFGSARNVHEAFQSMYSGPNKSARDWGELVREASPHQGPWPKVSIWHGDADTTVQPSNAQELVKQWTHVHGLPAEPTSQGDEGDRRLRQWRDSTGDLRVEEHVISGMAHGAPLHSDQDAVGSGVPGPYMLDVGISSTYEIAGFFGLVESSSSRALPKARISFALKTIEKAVSEALRGARLIP